MNPPSPPETDNNLTLINAVDANEVAALSAEWGAVPRVHHDLVVDHPFLSGPQQRIVSDGRRAEICYVMHRGDPGEGVLLHIKTIYPDGAFRLPTGGIHQGEGVFETLIREVYEETGLRVGEGADQVQVDQFLGVISYRLRHQEMGAFDFATYPFLVHMPADAELDPQDPAEQIGGWLWRPTNELADVAAYLDAVGNVDPRWADWGRYRALLHRSLAEWF